MAKDISSSPQPEPPDPGPSTDRPTFLDRAREIGGAVWEAGKPLFDHGRDEAAALIFQGNAHVMYGWGAEMDAGREPAVEPPPTPDKAPEKDRGMEL